MGYEGSDNNSASRLVLVAVATFVGKTRPIDNIIIQPARARRATGVLTGLISVASDGYPLYQPSAAAAATF